MIRGLALAALFLVAGSAPTMAQARTHGAGHVRPDSGKHHPHGPGHIRPDSAQHAAMHARLFGSWTGTLSSHQGAPTRLSMSIGRDSMRSVSLNMNAEQPMRLGAAKDFAVNGDKLTWTQDLAGAPCRATAVVTAAKGSAPEELKGTMACERDEITFSLRKNAG